MLRKKEIGRRRFMTRALAAGGALFVAGCDKLSHTEWFPRILGSAETLNSKVHHLIGSRKAMAHEFTEAELSPFFRSNGTSDPESESYQLMFKQKFEHWKLEVGGLVEQPGSFSLADLHGLPSRTQITRHDCVEGWSAIGKWKGVPLHEIMTRVRPKPQARYAVFYCADPMDDGEHNYYESIDMDDAFHPQTILAYELNGKPLPVANGAPIRLRVERQLGYKSAKYLMRIELVENFGNIEGGNGGYWEDQGYEWYAGI